MFSCVHDFCRNQVQGRGILVSTFLGRREAWAESLYLCQTVSLPGANRKAYFVSSPSCVTVVSLCPFHGSLLHVPPFVWCNLRETCQYFVSPATTCTEGLIYCTKQQHRSVGNVHMARPCQKLHVVLQIWICARLLGANLLP